MKTNEIILRACERLEKEYEDFKALKGTKTFKKLLGVYKSTSKEEKENSTESISYNSKLQNADYIADYLAEYVLNVLKDFCSKDVVFATQVLRFVGNFTGCLAYVIHGYISKEKQKAAQLSDIETYSRAVEYYFAGSKIQFQMTLELPKEFNTSPITEEELKNIEENYNNLLDLARAEKIAAEQEKAKLEAQQKARDAERKLKEEKAKARKQAKEAKEKAKKAQGSLFTEEDYKVEPTPKPTPKPKKAEPKPTAPAQEQAQEENKVIQISLFDNLLGGAD